jgi:hypothetical protein
MLCTKLMLVLSLVDIMHVDFYKSIVTPNHCYCCFYFSGTGKLTAYSHYDLVLVSLLVRSSDVIPFLYLILIATARGTNKGLGMTVISSA